MKILCFEINYIGFTSWQALARHGHKVRAIKVLYDKHENMSVGEAKAIVESYIQGLRKDM